MKVMFVSDGLETLTGIGKGKVLKKSVLDLLREMQGNHTEADRMRNVSDFVRVKCSCGMSL